MTTRVLGVLAGGDFPDGPLRSWASSADHLYAADSASERLVALGFSPVVVGDMDSARPEVLEGLRVVRDADPDRTDCDKMLDLIAADGHTAATVAGIEGDLMDHVLASVSSMARSSLRIRLVTRRGLAHVLRADETVRVSDAFGRRVSLIPVTPCTGVEIRGVLWEVSEGRMEPAGFLSVSNEGTGEVSASLASGTALLFIGGEPSEAPSW